jgi:hypothetical protein
MLRTYICVGGRTCSTGWDIPQALKNLVRLCLSIGHVQHITCSKIHKMITLYNCQLVLQSVRCIVCWSFRYKSALMYTKVAHAVTAAEAEAAAVMTAVAGLVVS